MTSLEAGSRTCVTSHRTVLPFDRRFGPSPSPRSVSRVVHLIHTRHEASGQIHRTHGTIRQAVRPLLRVGGRRLARTHHRVHASSGRVLGCPGPRHGAQACSSERHGLRSVHVRAFGCVHVLLDVCDHVVLCGRGLWSSTTLCQPTPSGPPRVTCPIGKKAGNRRRNRWERCTTRRGSVQVDRATGLKRKA